MSSPLAFGAMQCGGRAEAGRRGRTAKRALGTGIHVGEHTRLGFLDRVFFTGLLNHLARRPRRGEEPQRGVDEDIIDADFEDLGNNKRK